ncbi:cytochrome P450 [Actinopolyspora mortivallis]|uniref:Cytochrome P450 n=1 Tax=Actinopolyspora mortivallis TaxID=33906 RepID=A0A2T0GYD0_ACTMO|nr:cytochrome P450 [Actinopolyspora mortivallis]PRW64043.1 cytochrome P450 [Actinopolyspora mortivallis]
MTRPDDSAAPVCPMRRTPLHDRTFADDPDGVYESLRAEGPLADVELAPGVPATLVLDYDTALSVLRDPARFPKDSRVWQRTVPQDSPVVAMMMYRDNVLFQDGPEHDRLREAITDALGRVDSFTLRRYVRESAESLIRDFAPKGEADLLNDYARILPLLVLTKLFGSPPEITSRMVDAITALWDGVDTERANLELGSCVAEVVALRREHPAADVTTWLLEHEAGLDDEEMIQQLVVLMGAGAEPMQNLVANALRLWLSDERFAGNLSGGRLPVEDAIDEVLWQQPPLANYAITFPPQEVELAGRVLPAHQPVVIGIAAANNDPALCSARRDGNRAHLAWSAGAHTCPARGTARMIASVAMETVLDTLPDMDLAVPVERLEWRTGPFHRALTALPVHFPPVPVSDRDEEATGGSDSWSTLPARTQWTRQGVTSTRRRRSSADVDRLPGWNSLVEWLRGR